MNWQYRLNGRALHAVAQLTRRTCRFQVAGQEHVQAATATGRPIIFAAWHGMTMMLVGFFANYLDLRNILLILPDDWRGLSLVTFAHKLGVQPYPMDLEGREAGMGAARQLAKLVRQVKKENKQVYITPDGPFGPAYRIKPGISFIARKTNALILPVAGYARHGYVVPRWDRYLVPYPFARVSIAAAAPIDLNTPAWQDTEQEPIDDLITYQLHRITLQAAANYYEKVNT